MLETEPGICGRAAGVFNLYTDTQEQIFFFFTTRELFFDSSDLPELSCPHLGLFFSPSTPGTLRK